MSNSDKLTLEMHVDALRAALRAHDEHIAFTQAVDDLMLSPDEHARRQQERIEAEREEREQFEEACEDRARQSDWLAANLDRIASGSGDQLHLAWNYARAYLDLCRGEDDDAYDTDSLENWVHVIRVGMPRYTMKDMRYAISIIAESCRLRRQLTPHDSHTGGSL